MESGIISIIKGTRRGHGRISSHLWGCRERVAEEVVSEPGCLSDFD